MPIEHLAKRWVELYTVQIFVRWPCWPGDGQYRSILVPLRTGYLQSRIQQYRFYVLDKTTG